MAKAIREVYGETIKKYGELNKDIVVLDADVFRFYQICYGLEKSIRTVSITVVPVSTL